MKNKNLLVGANFLVPFILVASCFALWGFAGSITNPMVKAFSKIFRMSVTDGILIQVAFYGGYFAMALPAALFIQRKSFKAGIMLGLSLYTVGAFLFLPAAAVGSYYPFLIAYFVLTCGLSFLETSANPYILTMGDKETATMRLNLAQAFNPIGCLAGMFVAIQFIQSKLSPLSSAERMKLDESSYEAIKNSDLSVLSAPYIAIGIVVLCLLVLFVLVKMPSNSSEDSKIPKIIPTYKKLFGNKTYRSGLLAEFCYVGAQVMCWTFIIQLGTKIFMEEGMTEQKSEMLSQTFNMAGMVLFCAGRFICTYLMKFFKAHTLLEVLSAASILLLAVVIFAEGRICIYSLVLVSGCMSLMFPTIYSFALENVETENIKLAAAGLIMSILGGSVLPLLQAVVVDSVGPNISFVVPLVCFAVVLWYSRRKQIN